MGLAVSLWDRVKISLLGNIVYPKFFMSQNRCFIELQVAASIAIHMQVKLGLWAMDRVAREGYDSCSALCVGCTVLEPIAVGVIANPQLQYHPLPAAGTRDQRSKGHH